MEEELPVDDERLAWADCLTGNCDVPMYQRLKSALPDMIMASTRHRLLEREDGRPRFLVQATITLLNELAMAFISRRSGSKFRALSGKTALKLHLGCGRDIRPGWVNIDIPSAALPSTWEDRSGAMLIHHDLRQGLPLLEAESCDYIYSSHFFEHLDPQSGRRLMRDAHRALRPGGTFRLAVPDFRRLFMAYVSGDSEYFRELRRAFSGKLNEHETSLAEIVSYAVYQGGEHRTIYDEETLVKTLGRIGFQSVCVSSFQEGMDVDSPVRREYSFYVEAVK